MTGAVGVHKCPGQHEYLADTLLEATRIVSDASSSCFKLATSSIAATMTGPVAISIKVLAGEQNKLDYFGIP